MRTLFLLIALWLVYVIGKHLLKQQQQVKPPPRETDEKIPQATVKCAQCGVYLPAQEAITDAQFSYCCKAHRDQHQKSMHRT